MLKVENLCKRYKTFELKNVSFDLQHGTILGFIGANGAGKTTTIKSMLNLIKPDGGSVTFLGQDYYANENTLKCKLGFSLGTFDYYPKTAIKKIAAVERLCYQNWDEETYKSLMLAFKLDENKKPSELSGGMKVKLGIALALSHGAELIILDEPTAGLDPAARDDLIALFVDIVADGKRSIIFSTHITSDLEKCADELVFIRSGKIILSGTKDDVLDAHYLIRGKTSDLTEALKSKCIGKKDNAFGFTALIKSCDEKLFEGMDFARPTIEDLMIYYKED